MYYIVQVFIDEEWKKYSKHRNKEYALINAEIACSRGNARVMYGKDCVFEISRKEHNA